MSTDVICLICCRGGSKGIPEKNIKEFCGKPLLGWTLEHAQKANVFDEIILSTDSQEIAEVAENTIQRRNVKLRTELDDETGIQVSQIGDMFFVSNPRKQSNRFSRHIMRDLPNSTIMITTGTRGESFDVKYRFDAKGRRRAINILKNFGAK